MAEVICFQKARLALAHERQEIAAENARAATWGDLWINLIALWGDICLDTLDIMRHATLAALDGEVIDYRIIRDARQARMVCDHMEVIAQAQERNRQAVRLADAEHTGRLIREIFEEKGEMYENR